MTVLKRAYRHINDATPLRIFWRWTGIIFFIITVIKETLDAM